ncbi:YciE/YciF family protein (plasmid) [Mesorhizobium sp. 131-2-5]|jgi:ferritin-like metal-binding protein YciE|nr:YciE/YciF family protein [Mesorhizobium sp. 131-2-5]
MNSLAVRSPRRQVAQQKADPRQLLWEPRGPDEVGNLTRNGFTNKENIAMAATKKAIANKGLEDMFLDGLRDIYYAEKKILKALPKMARGAEDQQVTAAFEKHLAETEGQVERLEEVFEILGTAARGKTCPAIDGILEEGSEILEDYKGSVSLDAGLVGAAQAVEHYEIARYGTLIAWATSLGRDDVAELLNANLEEEKATDEALTSLGEAGVNDRAAEQQAA